MGQIPFLWQPMKIIRIYHAFSNRFWHTHRTLSLYHCNFPSNILPSVDTKLSNISTYIMIYLLQSVQMQRPTLSFSHHSCIWIDKFHFLYFFVPPIDISLQLPYLHTYRSDSRIIQSFLTNVVLVKSSLTPKIKCIFDQNSSLEFGWALICTVYHKRDPNPGGFNTYLDAEITTLFIWPNEELAYLYSMNLTIDKNIDLSKVIIYPNILIKLYPELLMSCPNISPFIYEKQYFHFIYINSWKPFYLKVRWYHIHKQICWKLKCPSHPESILFVFNSHPTFSYCKHPPCYNIIWGAAKSTFNYWWNQQE